MMYKLLNACNFPTDVTCDIFVQYYFLCRIELKLNVTFVFNEYFNFFLKKMLNLTFMGILKTDERCSNLSCQSIFLASPKREEICTCMYGLQATLLE